MTPPPIQEPPAEGWSLDQFVEGVERALNQLRIEASVPDRRTVRYYATSEVLDRPTMCGREARYGPRQFWQLLALKRLQSEGVRLAAIRARISRRPHEDLVEFVTAERTPEELAPTLSERPDDFWLVRPRDDRPAPAPTSERLESARLQYRLTLAPGVELTIDDIAEGTRLNATETAALVRSATPLLDLLTALGLRKEQS